jgi:carbonic anhydrase/acetyltransferase-like protein (isoleucine patch superfamily)
MQFVLDKNAKVQGNVKVGTPVTVQYEAKEEGQNLAVAVIAQG